MMADLSREELQRYSRHLVMPEVSLSGQQRLKDARVLCVGAGGLGSPVALYLAAAGIGTLGLAEFDHVDLSNIQRQVLYGSADVGRPKLEAACERLGQLNPHTELVPHALRLTADNVMAVVKDYDILVDGSDNFATRYLVNDAAVLAGKPNVHASVYRFEGQLSVFDAARGPCYTCLFPEPPPAGLVPSCAEGGVLGMLPGIIGCLQALEVVKLILAIGEPLIGRLLTFDGLRGTFRELRVSRDVDCAICGVDSTLRAPHKHCRNSRHHGGGFCRRPEKRRLPAAAGCARTRGVRHCADSRRDFDPPR
jgi:molybdopterin/thiamine biosynthesis adenylyltransferase